MLKAFNGFLLHKGSIKPQYVPFYLKWVSECYTFLNESPASRVNAEQRKQFLDHMSKHHEDWQVKQADTALRLYDYFLSREMKGNAEAGPSADGDWRALEEKMREMLRLRDRKSVV